MMIMDFVWTKLAEFVLVTLNKLKNIALTFFASFHLVLNINGPKTWSAFCFPCSKQKK